MAATDYQDASPDYADQIRQRILAQLSPDQTALPNDAVTPTPSPEFASPTARNGEAAVQAVGTPAGSVSQSQAGYAPVSGADLQVRQAPTATTSFYNANSGATANYDAGSGMYIDANGQQIRPDAIRTSNPSAFAGQPVAPAVAAADSGSPRINGATSGWQDQIRQLLMQRLQAAQQPVDPNSPEIAATVGAAKDQLSRQSDLERNALAERLYGQGGGGLNTNALTQQIQQSNEKQGTALGSLKATLLMNAYNQKHSELQNDLQLAVQSGDAESARAIQMEIAQLQAAVQRENIGVNLAEFTGQLNQNAALAGLR